ncbi:MAG: response regulator [Promethearchaeota archaeon]
MTSVFIIENDPTLQELYEKILENNGFQVVGKVSSGIDAIAQYQLFSIKPDVVIMDYRMPMKNGVETTKEILEIDNNARIIIISGDLTVEDEVLKQGAKKFLKKPFSYHQLVSEIDKLSNTMYDVPKIAS